MPRLSSIEIDRSSLPRNLSISFPLLMHFSLNRLQLLAFVVPIVILLGVSIPAHGQPTGTPYAGFEARQCHPLSLTPNQNWLLAVHSEAASLSVFDVTGVDPEPVRVAEIPVGLEPVSVRTRSDSEIWVVNEVSDSLSVITLNPDGTGVVVATFSTGDEPSDVVFAAGKAYVSCARFNEIWIHDVSSGAVLGTIPLDGLYPTALAATPSGDRVFASFLHSGNATTVLPRELAPEPPAPENEALPNAPRTTVIVPTDDPRLAYNVLDHDIVEIDTATDAVLRYFDGIGTNFLGLALNPTGDTLWASHTESDNLIRFEPELNGKFAFSRLAAINLSSGTPTTHDLNPGVDLDLLPNPIAAANALSQPTAIVFEPDGNHLWTAAFASDRVARIVASNGAIDERVDLRIGGTGQADEMRGPRGLAYRSANGNLYVLNKLGESLSVVDTQATTPAVTAEIALSSHEPLPLAVKAGRGFLFDARLSGNGLVSCGICHLDADRDGLAWDLGDPNGELQSVIGANLSIHDTTPRTRVLHPMKGPMVTQTLRGLQGGAPFHWRGDRAEIADFNPTFANLLGGEQIDADAMDDLTGYLLTVRHHPNPNRNPDRSLPTNLASGNPIAGRDLFNDHNKSHCITCHAYPNGSDANLDLPQEAGLIQPVKTATLRTVYQRLFFDPRPGADSPSGFGLLHDGTGFEMPIGHPYVLDNLNTLQELRDVSAFLLCYDTGTAPAVGRIVLASTLNRADQALLDSLVALEARAAAGDCEVVVRGRVQGEDRRWLYRTASDDYRSDRSEEGQVARSTLLSALASGETLSFMGVVPGQGNRFGGDADLDGVLDGNDPDLGAYNGVPQITEEPSDTAAEPGGTLRLEIEFLGAGATIQWFHNGNLLPGETAPVLEIANVTEAHAGDYQAFITNGEGDARTRLITVEVYPAPEITAHPTERSIVEGRSTSMAVRANGTGLSYQWLRGGQPIAGATSPTLSFRNAQGLDAGSYSVRVSNGAGSVVSNAATLTVIQRPVVNTTSLPVAIVGQDYNGPLSALHDPTRYAAGGLPPGLTVRRGATEITGRARKAGQFNLRLAAFNAAGSSRSPVYVTLDVEPFPEPAQGIYEAVLPRHAVLNDALGGWMKISTNRLASFSGVMLLGKTRVPVRGRWTMTESVDPHATVTVRRRNQDDLVIDLELDPGTRTVSGTVSRGGETLNFLGEGTTLDPAPFVGNHTLALTIPLDSESDPAIPQGDGIGSFQVNTRGIARGGLWLADGTRVRFAAPVTEEGRVRIFQLLHRRTGSLCGRLRIDPVHAHRLEGSELSWSKSPQTRRTRSYFDGFGPIDLEARGGLYEIPARGETVTDFDQVALVFSEGGAPDPATRLNVDAAEFPARPRAVATIPGNNPGLVRMVLQAGAGTRFVPGVTGTLSGNFTLFDPDTTLAAEPQRKRRSVFRGVVVDDGSGVQGFGFFNLLEMPSVGPPATTMRNSPLLSGRLRLDPLP